MNSTPASHIAESTRALDSISKEWFVNSMEENGIAIVKGVIDVSLIDALKTQLVSCIDKESDFHQHKNYDAYGMLVACPIYGGAFLKLADHRPFMEPFNWLLEDTCIIYVYTSSSMPPGQGNFSSRIHVDRPHFIPGFLEAMGSIILLDDFTEENGATWVLLGSHKLAEKPDEKFFYNNAVRIIAPKGSVYYFNLRLWHAGGVNYSNKWRHALGIGMIRGYMKQRIDLPRAMKDVDLSGVSDFGLQKLGFFAQPPSSLEEFYAPLEKRPFRQRSEWKV